MRDDDQINQDIQAWFDNASRIIREARNPVENQWAKYERMRREKYQINPPVDKNEKDFEVLFLSWWDREFLKGCGIKP